MSLIWSMRDRVEVSYEPGTLRRVVLHDGFIPL